MNEHTRTLLTYVKDGVAVEVTISHPRLDPGRATAIAHFLSNGCRIVPNVEQLPLWLMGLKPELQNHIVDKHLELTNIYMISMPATATVSGASLRHLLHLSELQHLSLSISSILPEDLRYLNGLSSLEILTFRGSSFGDEHFAHLPQLPAIRMIDIQSTNATAEGVARLQNEFPRAKIYFDV